MMKIPTQNVAAYILDLAARHGVRYEKGPDDDLAVALITRLSVEEVAMDDVENLLLALARAKVVSTRELLSLQYAYLQEKNGGIAK